MGAQGGKRRGVITRHDNIARTSHLLPDHIDEAVDARDLAHDGARLNSCAGVGADDRGRRLHLDHGQPRCSGRERRKGETQARRDNTARKRAALIEDLEVRRRPEVDDDKGEAEELLRSDHIGDTVGADLARVVEAHLETRLQARSHDKRARCAHRVGGLHPRIGD